MCMVSRNETAATVSTRRKKKLEKIPTEKENNNFGVRYDFNKRQKLSTSFELQLLEFIESI